MPISFKELGELLEKKKRIFNMFNAKSKNEIDELFKETNDFFNKDKDEILEEIDNYPESVGAFPSEEYDRKEDLLIKFKPPKKYEFPFKDISSYLKWAGNEAKNRIVGACDGSQIYPYPEINIPIALVQAIRLVYNYTYPTPKFERETNLDILGPLDILETNEQTQLTSVQNEPINTKRFLMEIKLLESAIKEYAKKFPETTSHFFLDGTLIPTFIQSYSKEHKKQHINAIKSCLDTSKANVRPILGYIDSSSAKDVLSLIKIVTQSPIKTDLISDATLLEYYIKSKKGLNQEIHWGDRTCAFICERNDQNYKNLHENKETYKIAFFYIKLNSGQMARVEFPTWCLKKDGMVEEIAQIVRIQSAMGNGYPYIIDKCHHEAIITAKDRMKFLGMFQEFCKKNNINFKIYNKFRSKLRSNYIS